jgi:hypothetical protein
MSKIVMLMIQGVGPIVGELVEVSAWSHGTLAPETPPTVLKRPVMVGVVPGRTPQEKGQLGFNPYLEFCTEFEAGVPFAASSILHTLTPLLQVENAYRQNYSESGLIIPPPLGGIPGGLHRV